LFGLIVFVLAFLIVLGERVGAMRWKARHSSRTVVLREGARRSEQNTNSVCKISDVRDAGIKKEVMRAGLALL